MAMHPNFSVCANLKKDPNRHFPIQNPLFNALFRYPNIDLDKRVFLKNVDSLNNGMVTVLLGAACRANYGEVQVCRPIFMKNQYT